MNFDDRQFEAPKGGAVFVTTHWQTVVEAGAEPSAESAAALERLCRTYWYPLYTYVRRQGYGVHEAQDLTQEFFARLLSRNYFRGLDRQRGRFRSWLLASLEHFLAKEWRDSNRLKRGGGAVILSLDQMDPEERYRLEPVEKVSADRIYEWRWALTVVEQTLDRLKGEFESADRLKLFEQLQPMLTREGSREIYEEIAGTHAMTPGAVKAAVHRLRQRYGELLREEVAQTVTGPDEVEEELRHLVAVLAE